MAASSAAAENIAADSIDWATIDSHLVVRGSVSQVKPVGPQSPWSEVTLVVSESLRGPKVSEVTFLGARLADAERWRSTKAELLVFLVESGPVRGGRNSSRAHHALRPGTQSVVELAGKPRAFTSSFEMLNEPTMILAAVRTASGLAPAKRLRLEVPTDVPAYRALYAGSSVSLFVTQNSANLADDLALLRSHDQRTLRRVVNEPDALPRESSPWLNSKACRRLASIPHESRTG